MLFRSEILKQSMHGHRKLRCGSNTDLLEGLLRVQKKLTNLQRHTEENHTTQNI